MKGQTVLDMISSGHQPVSLRRAGAAAIERLDRELASRFEDRLIVQKSLTRSLVSFQSNKDKPAYRWYKYKEAFSAPLLEYLFHHYKINGKILDPFAGSGTALFAAIQAGMDAEGIELLPIGQQIINVRKLLESDFSLDDFLALERWADSPPWKKLKERESLCLNCESPKPRTRQRPTQLLRDLWPRGGVRMIMCRQSCGSPCCAYWNQ